MKSACEVIEWIEHVRGRKQMYFQRVDVEAVENWINGFCDACNAMLDSVPVGAWTTVAEQRGWVSAAKCASTLMRERGMMEEAIIEELFAMLIETVRRIFPA